MLDMTEPAGRRGADAVPAPERAIIDVTPHGIVTRWDPVATLLYGYTEEEIVGRSADVLFPQGARELAEILRRVTEGRRSERYEAERVRKDGTAVRVSVIVSPVIGADGDVVGLNTVTQEADGPPVLPGRPATIDTERRNARSAQQRADTQRRDARDAQERIDVQADTQRRDARDTQERIDVQGGIQRRDARNAQEAAEAAQDSNRRDAQDLFDERRDDERREALAQNEGLHAQVRRIQRMDSLGQLAGGVAHDFNNLLAVILSYSTFVARRLDAAAQSSGDASWDEARADMAHIQQAVDRAGALTRQLLAFASREAIRPLALDLNEVISGVEELLRRAIGEHIELTTSLAEGLRPILADPGKLEQVLVNLAVNARDAMPGGGTLTIATENVAADASSADGSSADGDSRPHHVRLRVSDTGSGMTPDVIEHVFEPFFTTKAIGRGTGLGLATVYGILTQAGADIQISSQPGDGTTFTIVLPVTTEVAAPVAQIAPAAREQRGKTVLLVEDGAELREVARRILADAGYHVLAAASGPEALDIARNHEGPIDLLITDIVMPEMLGPEVAERMQAIKPAAAVLYMSGYAWPLLAAQGRLAPDTVLLEKPFSVAELLERAGQALSRTTAA
jgi:two-component system, cell cycle sensor histidine kinase and response regulator CckA